MFERPDFRTLAGALLLVPFLTFAACEQPGDQQMDQDAGEQAPVQGEQPTEMQQDEPATTDPATETDQTQRREAEPPEQPQPPTTEGATAGAGGMEVLSVDAAGDLSSGTHELTCQVRGEAGQEGAATEQDIQLTVSVQDQGTETDQPDATTPEESPQGDTAAGSATP